MSIQTTLAPASARTARVKTAGAQPLPFLGIASDSLSAFYADIIAAFSDEWQRTTGRRVDFQEYYGSSGELSLALASGLPAGVIQPGTPIDLEQISNRQRLVSGNWRHRFPNGSSPFTSTLVFLVHRGNPSGIFTWDDLARPDISVITASPREDSQARWNYIALWAYATLKYRGYEPAIRRFVATVLRNSAVFDVDRNEAAGVFTRSGIGDVLVAWENDAYRILREHGSAFQVVTPGRSIRIEFPVAVATRLDSQTDAAAQAFVEFLYSPQGQELARKHYLRPAITDRSNTRTHLPPVETFRADDVLGSWRHIQKSHFKRGGTFDQIEAALTFLESA